MFSLPQITVVISNRRVIAWRVSTVVLFTVQFRFHVHDSVMILYVKTVTKGVTRMLHTYLAIVNKKLRSVHFGVGVVELI